MAIVGEVIGVGRKRKPVLNLVEAKEIPDEVLSKAGAMFLRGEEANGRHTIRRVYLSEGRYGLRVVLETNRGLITLNKTSARRLYDAWGRNTSEWVQKVVDVKQVDMMVGGRMIRGQLVEPVE